MSIPKEPRQIMINLMYIVLTAMLALNVSAEILNAFFSMDKSIRESTDIVGRSNEVLLAGISKQAEAYPQFKVYDLKAHQLKQDATRFCNYVERLKEELIEVSGGLGEDGLPFGRKNKDVTTRLLVEEGKGMVLRDSVLALRQRILQMVDDSLDLRSLEESIPLDIPDIPKDSDKKDWADFSFRQMPVAAVIPMLTKFQADARVAETSLLNYLAGKISARPVHDEYQAIIAADKSYVIRGENLEAEIFLGAYSSTTDNISVKVNGRTVPVRNGKALFNTLTDRIGAHDLNVEITSVDPRSGLVEKFQKRFKYEVGERSVTTAADKMNVFYLGLENPFSVSAAGVPTSEVRVRAEGAAISPISNGRYNVKPTRTGIAKITVSGGGLEPTVFEYRVKPVPTPTAKLGDKVSGKIKMNVFRAYNKIYPHLENFDFDARCKIQGFELTRVKKNGDVSDCRNQGGTFGSRARQMVDRAKRGDTYYFDNIKAKCPGDNHNRKLNGLVFRIQ